MTDLLWLVASAAVVLAAAYLPAVGVLRLLGAGRLVRWGLAPALSAAVAGIGAIATAALSAAVAPGGAATATTMGLAPAALRWSLLPYLAAWALIALVALLARRAGVGLALGGVGAVDGADAGGGAESVDAPHGRGSHAAGALDQDAPLLAVRGAAGWIAAAGAVALVPIAMAFSRPDGILQRWDTLYHLSALRLIREGGDGSSLHLGVLSNSAGRPVPYPAAFHDLASLVPGAPIPVLLNAATASLAVVPWALGLAILARVLWPEHRWGPTAAAIIALLAPAAPLDEWIHLSAIPNLTGFAMLPGVLAAGVILWRAVLGRDAGPGTVVCAAAVLAAAGAGLALIQPNVAVMAVLLLAVLTAVTGAAHWRSRPALAAVPLVLLVPVALLAWTPLGATVTGFSGGLVVPWWQGLGEILLNLLTVWPMALGVVLALLWWPGLVSVARSRTAWLAVAWGVVALLYLDAAVDSSANLSVLFYRGQDRLSMPLTMLTTVLAVPGLAAWGRVLGKERLATRSVAAILVVAAVVAAGTSVPDRLDKARLNADLADTQRPRFLQEDELAAFARASPRLDREGVILASPFSGAAHLYAMQGQAVRFPVAGMSWTDEDQALLAAVPEAATDPAACRVLRDAGIRYVYQENVLYQYAPLFDPLARAGSGLGPVVLETPHSRLIEVDCR
ncbi:DUF6541 family protein [Brachybacterium huguangmaarense]